MASVEIRGLNEFVRGLSEFELTHLKFAQVKTLTDIAWIAKTNTINEMRSVFDRPTNFTLNSLQVDRATKQKLSSRIWFKPVDVLRKEHYLIPQVNGGNRNFKPFEGRLFKQGILPSNYYTVPANGADFDAFGNMSRGQIVQILSFFDSFRESGYDANMGAAGRARLARGARNRYGIGYFVIKPGQPSHLKPGIYKKVYSNFGSAIMPVLIFVRSIKYRKKLDMQKIADKTYDENFSVLFNQNFENAVNSSWT